MEQFSYDRTINRPIQKTFFDSITHLLLSNYIPSNYPLILILLCHNKGVRTKHALQRKQLPWFKWWVFHFQDKEMKSFWRIGGNNRFPSPKHACELLSFKNPGGGTYLHFRLFLISISSKLSPFPLSYLHFLWVSNKPTNPKRWTQRTKLTFTCKSSHSFV